MKWLSKLFLILLMKFKLASSILVSYTRQQLIWLSASLPCLVASQVVSSGIYQANLSSLPFALHFADRDHHRYEFSILYVTMLIDLHCSTCPDLEIHIFPIRQPRIQDHLESAVK